MTTPTPIQLTAIEQQLLFSLSTGTSNKQLARDLNKSEFTVRNQLSSLYKKIRVTNRTHAVFWYRDHLRNAMEQHRVSTSVPLPERRKSTRIAV